MGKPGRVDVVERFYKDGSHYKEHGGGPRTDDCGRMFDPVPSVFISRALQQLTDAASEFVEPFDYLYVTVDGHPDFTPKHPVFHFDWRVHFRDTHGHKIMVRLYPTGLEMIGSPMQDTD